MVGAVRGRLHGDTITLLADNVLCVGDGDEERRPVLAARVLELLSDICEELAIRASFAHHFLTLEDQAEGMMGLRAGCPPGKSQSQRKQAGLLGLSGRKSCGSTALSCS